MNAIREPRNVHFMPIFSQFRCQPKRRVLGIERIKFLWSNSSLNLWLLASHVDDVILSFENDAEAPA
jgi:hypothetical protein